MEYKDYYQTLGVAKTATEDEIKKAYRKLVRKYHPDVSKEADAQKKTQELNEAYGVLGDAEKRAAYDDHCSFDSLHLLPRTTPVYLYCLFDELFAMLRELGFTNVQSLAIERAVIVVEVRDEDGVGRELPDLVEVETDRKSVV